MLSLYVASKMLMMRQLAKFLLTNTVGIWARGARFSFPEKYTWRWKFAMLAGFYEKGTTRLLKKIIRPGMTVVDIGAHIGYFTRLAAKRAGPRGHVYAFEPDPDNRLLLEKNVHSYSFVSVGPEAITSKVGTVSFYHVHGSTGCHSIIPQPNASEFTVPATTLDAFVESRRITHIDVIKMDIEGGEWAALEGMRNVLKQKPLSIITEWKPDVLMQGGHNPEMLLSMLEHEGFSLSVITDAGLFPLEPGVFAPAREYLDNTGSVNVYARK